MCGSELPAGLSVDGSPLLVNFKIGNVSPAARRRASQYHFTRTDVLNITLQSFGFSRIPAYDVFAACWRCQDNLRNALRTMEDFIGLTAQTPMQCLTVREQKTR